MVLGANNASACFGASIGAGLTKYSTAARLASFGVLLGVLVEGVKLSRAISGGILTEITTSSFLIIMATTFIIILLATILHLPLPLSGGFVGSAVGVGLAGGEGIDWSFTLMVFASWVATPLLSAVTSALLYGVTSRLTHGIRKPLMLNYLYGRATLALSFYVAYVLGANTVGLISGVYSPFVGYGPLRTAAFGLATALGMCLLSRGVTETVGREMLGLSPSMALAAQLSGALIVHIFTQFGMPVSITQSLVGGVIGVGLAKKITVANVQLIRNILIGWALAPILGVMGSLTLTYLNSILL